MKNSNTTHSTLPKVSILISVYNQLHCLSKALESALMQNYANFEIVIGDDASTDGDVSAYIQTFDDGRIKYFCNERNLGMIDNFHTMLYEYATGDYAVMLNADDYWIDGEFICKAMKIFRDNKEVVLVFGDVKVHASNSLNVSITGCKCSPISDFTFSKDFSRSSSLRINCDGVRFSRKQAFFPYMRLYSRFHADL